MLTGTLPYHRAVPYNPNARSGSFQSRDNISNFIAWCRGLLGIPDCLLFETEDLVSRKNERHVVLCLLEVARRGARYGMQAPLLIQVRDHSDNLSLIYVRSPSCGAVPVRGGQEGGHSTECRHPYSYRYVITQITCRSSMYGPRHVVLCLLEVARRGARYGMQAPLLIQVRDHSDNLSLIYERSPSCGAVPVRGGQEGGTVRNAGTATHTGTWSLR